MHIFCGLLFESEFGADLLEFVFGETESLAILPVLVEGHEVDVGVGDVGADNLPNNAGAELFLEMLGEFLDRIHESLVAFIVELVDFVDLVLRDDEGVTLGLGVDVEEGEGFIVLVDFVAGYFTVDDFCEHAWLHDLWSSL